MSIWKYVGAGLGGAAGFVLSGGNPAGAAAGAYAGYGLGAGADAANESSDAADAAKAAAAGVTTPQIGPNAGVGSGWGGVTQGEQAASMAAFAAKNPGTMDVINRVQSQRDAAAAAGNTAEVARLDAILAKQHATVQAAANQVERPDMSDPARFNAQAQASYGRQAPQLGIVKPDMANYGADRSMFGQGGTAMDQQINSRRADQSGVGQQGLINRLNNDLTGAAPSLAQAQLAQTTDQNIAQQHAMAASAGPMDYGSASRAAIMAGANTQQQAVQQAAILRAQEYQAAETGLGSALTQKRQSDVNVMSEQNKMMIEKRAQDLKAAGIDSDTAIAQAKLEAQQRLSQGELTMQQGTLNQQREGTYLDAYMKSRAAQQNNAQFNANANLDAQRIKAGLQGTAVNAQMQDAASQRQMAGSMISAGASMGMAGSQGGGGGGSTAPTYKKPDDYGI